MTANETQPDTATIEKTRQQAAHLAEKLLGGRNLPRRYVIPLDGHLNLQGVQAFKPTKDHIGSRAPLEVLVDTIFRPLIAQGIEALTARLQEIANGGPIPLVPVVVETVVKTEEKTLDSLTAASDEIEDDEADPIE